MLLQLIFCVILIFELCPVKAQMTICPFDWIVFVVLNFFFLYENMMIHISCDDVILIFYSFWDCDYLQWLMPSEGGYLEAEGIEKTWRIKQESIAREVDISSSKNQYDIVLPGGCLLSGLFYLFISLLYFVLFFSFFFSLFLLISFSIYSSNHQMVRGFTFILPAVFY